MYLHVPVYYFVYSHNHYRYLGTKTKDKTYVLQFYVVKFALLPPLPTVFSGVRDAQSLVLSETVCRSALCIRYQRLNYVIILPHTIVSWEQ
jgi:hypothetical protein